MSVEPPDLYHLTSRLGTVVCDTCGTSWPCHLSAWGRPDRHSHCQVRGCDGDVSWELFEVDP